jgi:hypothetical protein
VCRKDIRKFKVKKNKMIDNAVKQMIITRCETNGNKEDLEKYNNRLSAYKLWKEKHVIVQPLKVGDKVDVRDTEHIWCTG